MVVFRTCIKLGVPEEALKLATEKVKYGLFPMKNATHELLMTFVEAQNIEGMQSCDCHVMSSTRVEDVRCAVGFGGGFYVENGPLANGVKM